MGRNFLDTVKTIDSDWKMATNIRQWVAMEYLKVLFQHSCRLTEDT
jgi:hypothetical protein